MALVNFGAVVNDARGKVNGNVFSKNRSGPYIRRKVTGTNPATVFQAQARTYLATMSQAWSGTLTAAQRAAWTSFATLYPITNVFGLQIALNGLNMYVRINTALLQIGAAVINDPPASPATIPVPVDPASYLAQSFTTMSFVQTAVPPTAGTLFYVFASPGLAAGRKAVQSQYRLLGAYTPAPVTVPHTVDISANYVTRFGNITTGLRYAILVSTIDPTIGIPTVGVPMETIAI